MWIGTGPNPHPQGFRCWDMAFSVIEVILLGQDKDDHTCVPELSLYQLPQRNLDHQAYFFIHKKGARQEILKPWYGEEFQSQKRKRSYHSLAYSQDYPGQSWGWNSDPVTLTKPHSMMWTVAILRESGLCFWLVLPDRIFNNFNRNLRSLSCLKTFPQLPTTCKIHFKLFS